MPINGWYVGDNDNVTDDGNINGWTDQSGNEYGGHAIAGGDPYRFGNVINHYGTWGQLIYSVQNNLIGQDLAAPDGLNGHMPLNPGPGNSNWVQGHLVNGECGGRGNIDANLTPITGNLNNLHRGYEAVLQRLINRGAADGALAIMFNPNNIANTRLIYRTQGLPPPAGAFLNVPNGIVVSIGFVINGVMQNLMNVQNEFQLPFGANSWFANRYYIAAGAIDRQKIIEMVGGVELGY